MQPRLGSVREMPPVVRSLAFAKFETHIKNTIWFERRPESPQRFGQGLFGQMQEARAGPNAVVAGDLIDLIECTRGNSLTHQRGRHLGERR